MSETRPNKEVTQAVVKGALLEAVLIAGGVALYLATDQIWPLIVAAILGSALILLLMLQAGAFTRADDRR